MALLRIAKRIGRGGLLTAVAITGGALARGQYPGHPQGDKQTTAPVARATAVLEWTGDVSKPTASRLVPIAVFDGHSYQPAGLYLAQPAPLALESGTIYELQQAGVAKGEFDVDGARNVQGTWLGFGKWKAMAVAKVPKLQASKIMPQVVTDKDPDKPTLHRAAGSEGDSGKTGAATSGSAGSATTDKDTAEKKPATDPDRPTLHKRTADGNTAGSDNGGASSSGTTTAVASSAPDVDPDRPTLHKRTDDASKSGSDKTGPTSPVTATTDTDPDRPRLKHGTPVDLEKMLEPDKLVGMPVDMEQMAAVSDTKSRDTHAFVYQWGTPEDATKMQAAMEDLAKKALAADRTKPAAAPAKQAVTGTRAAAAAKRPKLAAAAVPLPDVENEKFEAYELSYSGGSTLVLSAESGDAGDARRYVTVLAQPDFYGALKVLLQSVTSAAQLDVTPRMRLVDAVDTDGDNRAELVFELRGKSDREFAIYRVAGGRAEQVFNTGSLP